jgi:hypothetical protein
VLSTTTLSAAPMKPVSRSCRAADRQAAVSGQRNVPSSRATSICSASRSWSLTATAVPSVARTASSTRKSPSALGTVMPKATVRASGNGRLTSAPSAKASTMGAHPAAWTATSRGRSAPIQPSSCSSRSAL